MVNTEIKELKNILLDFIVEQKQFNSEQKQFNSEQKQFNSEQKQFNSEQKQFNSEILLSNQELDKKIDKVQYYLEETMASHTKMFFWRNYGIKIKSWGIEWRCI